METDVAVENGILFILDPSNRGAIVPDYRPGEVCGWTDSCVSVPTIADVDGNVTVSLDFEDGQGGTRARSLVFEGSIETPGRRLAIVSIAMKRVLEIEVPGAAARLRVGVDDVDFPSAVSVTVLLSGTPG